MNSVIWAAQTKETVSGLSLFLASLPKWVITSAVAGAALLAVSLPFLLPHRDFSRTYRVAFMGNSMQYFNDFPRVMEVISGGRITQDSCFKGAATMVNLLQSGNGMYQKWSTKKALIEGEDDLYDFGACTVHQLLFGYDQYLTSSDWFDVENYTSVDDDYQGFYNDGSNPCFEDLDYLEYKVTYYLNNPPKWDYVVINDNTRSPARKDTREQTLEILQSTYVPWFQKLGAIPVLLDTHAYWTDWRNMDGLVDVPTFTSLTYEGYREYAEVLGSQLPAEQQPRIAPVGIAFLVIWEENYNMWLKLFHYDEVHASPYGTFLQSCIMHHTLFGYLPLMTDALPTNISTLFARARRMQPPTHPRKPFPTLEEAQYLYRVAERVVDGGYVPKSFTFYQNGEAAIVNSTEKDGVYSYDANGER
jgi:hypothetical protein